VPEEIPSGKSYGGGIRVTSRWTAGDLRQSGQAAGTETGMQFEINRASNAGGPVAFGRAGRLTPETSGSSPNPARETSFPVVLRRRLHDFFIVQRQSPNADPLMIAKPIVGLSAWSCSYAALYVFHLRSWMFVLVYLLHGLTHVFLLLNIAHDSDHTAISRRIPVNKVFPYVFDLCGVSSCVWRILHHGGRHSCINVHGEDEAIEGRRVFRFSSRAPRKRAHRSDYATRNPVVTFLVGGLNHHVAHHLCPYACHTHYPQLTKIIRETGDEYRIPYREQKTMGRALKLHLALLKGLGDPS
jgi:hypothetical protein